MPRCGRRGGAVAGHFPVDVDCDDGLVVPLGSRFNEEQIVLNNQCFHGVPFGTQKESPLPHSVLVYVLIAHDVSLTYLL